MIANRATTDEMGPDAGGGSALWIGTFDFSEVGWRCDFAPMEPLPRSTSRLRIRDHINSMLGYEHDKPRPSFVGPATRTTITTHEESFFYRYLVYESSITSDALYFKWNQWVKDDAFVLEDIVETRSQLKRTLKGLKKREVDASIVRHGTHPNEPCTKLAFRVDHFCESDFFSELVRIVLGGRLSQPMDTQRKSTGPANGHSESNTTPVLTAVVIVGVSLNTRPADYAIVKVWLEPSPDPERVKLLVEAIAGCLPSAFESAVRTAALIDPTDGLTVVFAQADPPTS